MSSQGGFNVSTSPQGGKNTEGGATSPPKGQCLCSPTTHQGSFRCRFHRASGSSSWKMKPLPTNKSDASYSPKSVETIWSDRLPNGKNCIGKLWWKFCIGLGFYGFDLYKSARLQLFKFFLSSMEKNTISCSLIIILLHLNWNWFFWSQPNIQSMVDSINEGVDKDWTFFPQFVKLW